MIYSRRSPIDNKPSAVQWCSGCSGPKPGMWGGYYQRSNLQVRWFKSLPSRKLGLHNSPLRKVWFEFGIIGPWQAREAIPQPAGLAELVFGDQELASVRAVGRALHKPFLPNKAEEPSEIIGQSSGTQIHNVTPDSKIECRSIYNKQGRLSWCHHQKCKQPCIVHVPHNT